MPLHLDEFQGAEFQGFVENIPRDSEYKLVNVLPDENTKDINFSYGVINGEYAKGASITGFNASAPLRDPKQLSKAFGSVAKLQHGQRLDEEQLLHFNRPRDDEEKAQVVEYVYDLTDDLVTGVRDVEEYLRASAVYNGKIDYQDPENDIQVNVNFNFPEDNKLSADNDWDSDDATPLDDIHKAIEQFKSANKRKKPVVMHMTSATEAKLLRNTQLRMQVYGEAQGKRLVTKEDVVNVFDALGFPPYEINDDVVNVGDEGEQQLLDDNKIVLIGDEVGKTFFGPTVENNYNSGIYAITEVQETSPPMQKVFIGETVFPAIKKPSAVVTMTVGETSNTP